MDFIHLRGYGLIFDMAKTNQNPADPPSEANPSPKTLRQRAEEMLGTTRTDVSEMDADEVQRLVHELQVRQMELEIQNEELRQAQVELSEALDRYADLYEFAPAGYVTLEKTGKILEANLAAATLLDIERKDLVGRNLAEFIDRDSQDEWFLHRQAVFNEEAKQTCEVAVNRASGGERTVCLESTAFAAEPEPRCRTTLIDITKRKESEEEQRREHELSEGIVNTAQAIILLLDLKGRILRFNPYLEQISGWKLEDVQGMDWFDTFLPKRDRETIRALFETATSGERTQGNVNPIVTKDGEERDIEWYDAALTDNTGKMEGLLCVGRDITERIKAERALHDREERLRTILNTAADAIITIDRGGIIVSVNPATEAMFGYPNGDLLGENVKVLMPEPYHGEHDGYLKHYHATGEKRIIGIGREVMARRKDGSTFPVSLAVSEVDHLGIYTGILRDITEQKRYEENLEHLVEERTRELREAQDELLKAERLATVGRLAAGVAHEMRTPLGVIRNAVHYLEATEDPTHDEELPEVMAEMNRAVSSTNHIISELLDYVREPVRDFSDFPIGESIEPALRLAEPPENVAVTREGEDSVLVRGDRGQITRILLNLAQNAVHAMEPEGGELTAAVSRNGEEEIRVEIRDTGCGIPEENLRKVFDPLFSTKTRGIGLGLAISKRYAELNEGRLEVESEAGAGAVFRLTLKAAS